MASQSVGEVELLAAEMTERLKKDKGHVGAIHLSRLKFCAVGYVLSVCNSLALQLIIIVRPAIQKNSVGPWLYFLTKVVCPLRVGYLIILMDYLLTIPILVHIEIIPFISGYRDTF